MHYQISEHQDYIRAVVSDGAGIDDFVAFYKELQTRCTVRGFDRALVVVRPETGCPDPTAWPLSTA